MWISKCRRCFTFSILTLYKMNYFMYKKKKTKKKRDYTEMFGILVVHYCYRLITIMIWAFYLPMFSCLTYFTWSMCVLVGKNHFCRKENHGEFINLGDYWCGSLLLWLLSSLGKPQSSSVKPQSVTCQITEVRYLLSFLEDSELVLWPHTWNTKLKSKENKSGEIALNSKNEELPGVRDWALVEAVVSLSQETCRKITLC